MNENTIFNAAVKLPPQQRSDFLAAACHENSQMREEVEALLCEHDGVGSFMQSPPAGACATLDLTTTEQPGTLIGRYKLLEQIGEGGMGVVFVAEQTEPVRRRVALKIIKPGMDTKQVIARFEAERQALAMMDHPNIAKILDAGTTGSPDSLSPRALAGPQPLTPGSCPLTPGPSRPYFVMELVRGLPITDYCDKAKLSPRQRLELFIDVCQAVQHAHQKGIIHRDLKPSNVMVTMQDGRAVVKVIDFGVAKAVGQQLTERTVYTALTQLIGTPLYMSPEQAELTSNDVDTRSDVYSLGVLLYELLTGQTPFDKETLNKAGFDEMRRMIREDEPETVSTRIARTRGEVRSAEFGMRNSGIRSVLSRVFTPHSALRIPHLAELDWIVMRSLEKDRTRRYESPSSLAADIQRYLTDEPVQACPPSTLYRLRKYSRKHKTAVTTAIAITVSLLFGTAISTWQAVRATSAEARARSNEDRAVAEESKARNEEQRARIEQQNALAAATSERIAHAAEVEQRRRAENSEAQAQRNLESALDAVDRLLTHLGSEELYEVPNAQAARRKILEDAIRFYEQFLTQSNNSPQIRFRLARTWPRMAYLLQELGNDIEDVYASDLGDLPQSEAAKRCNDVGLFLIQQLVAEEPNNFDYLNLLADNCTATYTHSTKERRPLLQRAEEIYWQLASTGRQPTHSSPVCYGSLIERYIEALVQLGKADLAIEATERYPVSKRRRGDALYCKAGQLAKNSPDAARSYYRQCVQAYREWLADEPRGRDHLSVLSVKFRNAGSLIGLDNSVEGKALLHEALGMIRPLAVNFPQNPLYQRRLAETLRALGSFIKQESEQSRSAGNEQQALQLLAEADTFYIEAIAVAGKVAKAYPPQFGSLPVKLLSERANVALALAEHASSFPDGADSGSISPTKSNETAVTVLEEAIQLCRALTTDFPDSTDYKSRLADLEKLHAQHFGQKEKPMSPQEPPTKSEQ